DPCCGSGHFLVAAFLMLVPMRMELEELSPQEAVDSVLRDNLHGLEIDQRCVELAAFALALTAWKYPGADGYRQLPQLNVACSGLAISAKREEWLELAGDDDELQGGLAHLYQLFQQAPILGSLINPTAIAADFFNADYSRTADLLEQALSREADCDESCREMEVVAQGLAKAATLLAGRYHLVATNVPYLSRGKQDEQLREFCASHYPAAKNDLATVFLDRCLEFCHPDGTVSAVLPQNWLFLTSYKKFREKLLKHDTWHQLARLGPGAFETISGEVVKAILITLSRGNSPMTPVNMADNDNLLHGLDVSVPRTAAAKAAGLLTSEIKSVAQAKQLENPDARVALEEGLKGNLLEAKSYSHHGLTSGDMPRMKFSFWELTEWMDVWIPFQSTIKDSQLFGGNESLLRWESGNGTINELQGARKDGMGAWGSQGVLISQMRELPVALYSKYAFDNNTAVIIPNNPSHLPAIWCFCSSPVYNEAVRRIDQKLNVTNATLVKVPFDLDHWTKVSAEKYPNGLPNPYSDDPTQWIFHGHPCGSVVWDEESRWTAHGSLRTDDTVLQVAVARLLGYRWPAELDEEMELAAEQRQWVKRCESLLPYADEDGIVCIPPVRGEAAADDRLLNLLAAAYGKSWSADTLARLLASSGCAGKTLGNWLREKFFIQHCKLFHHRPFIWHIWDGLPDGFAALVNYHKLDYKLLETLIYTYLGDWIARQQQDIANGIDGAVEKLAAAENLKKKLELILEGEATYDIFIRWKPLGQQPLGWQPDLNDGIRLNIRPFITVGDVRKKGAGVLRDKPNIHWKKDRGKDVESAPWYHLGPQYGGKEGDRINDHHLTLEEKRQARNRT
ncbi:MAG: restriction endonuclease subunit M, partial [Desulfobacca sp. 4484_104]